MKYRLWASVLALFFLGSMLVPRAKADEDNKEIRFSVNRPVEVPTSVIPAGQYDLKLMGDGSTVAGLWNASGTKFYGFFETIPVDRRHALSKTKVVLAESVKNAPPRVEEWFYPGENSGNEILYPVTAHRDVQR
jgi:hypothetical protein